MTPTRGSRQNKSSDVFKNTMRFVRKLTGQSRGSTPTLLVSLNEGSVILQNFLAKNIENHLVVKSP